jgi:ribose-phosphate pyrophosphokinase
MIETTLDLTGQGVFERCGSLLKYKKSTFPAGEQYIKICNDSKAESVRVNARCQSSDELMTIILAIDALKLEGFTRIELFIPYLPYARQDRMCNKGESFSLRTICKIINMLDISKVMTYDVHSNVTNILLERHTDYDNRAEVRQFVQDCVLEGRESIALIVPDNGAWRKSEFLFNAFPSIFDKIVVCRKRRTPDGVEIAPIESNILGMKAVVVDDICDGGATFLTLGERLREAGVHDSYLFVSHGIFSAGIGRLLDYYKNIGTTDSFYNDRAGLNVYKLGRLGGI